jgi:hypothetical protein
MYQDLFPVNDICCGIVTREAGGLKDNIFHKVREKEHHATSYPQQGPVLIWYAHPFSRNNRPSKAL